MVFFDCVVNLTTLDEFVTIQAKFRGINVRKKVLNIEEIWDGKELLIRDFSNLDLEGLDLSKIPLHAWKNVKFYNTSVKNTKINLSLRYLKDAEGSLFGKQTIKNCDFSYNNLATINNHLECSLLPKFENCNFGHTNLSKFIYGKNNILDESCTEYIPEYNIGCVDIETIKNNPQLNVGPVDILLAICDSKNHYANSYYHDKFFLNSIFEELKKEDLEKQKEYFENLEKLLDFDKSGELKKLYTNLLPLNEKQKFFFFFGYIIDYDFSNKSFVDVSKSLGNFIRFYDCKFKDTILNYDFEKMKNLSIFTLDKSENEIQSFIMPSLSMGDWKENTNLSRFSDTPLTFKTNLYLELDRICNCKCQFCRNQTYNHVKYDVKKMNKALKKLIPYVDSIIIGGGEPSLRLRDIEKLDNLSEFGSRIIFTNGSCKDIDRRLEKITYNGYDYYISRHHYEEEKNAQIFGINKAALLNTEELKIFILNNKVTLSATCFKGGLDSTKKILKYIDYCIGIGCKNILISDLQQDQSLNKKGTINMINIDSNIFDSVIDYLKIDGFEENYPIYSTGGYVSRVLKYNNITIAFKHYITLKELEYYWPRAMKRTFDLSMDPFGNVYENWHQNYGLVKKLSK